MGDIKEHSHKLICFGAGYSYSLDSIVLYLRCSIDDCEHEEYEILNTVDV